MKKIAIIGGGISGLATLHFLKQRLGDSAEVILLEKDTRVGGKIFSQHTDGVCFEIGPNGFLDNQPATLELIEQLGLTGDLITANSASKRRYIQMGGQLHLLPMDPVNFIKTPLLTAADKFGIIGGLFKKNVSLDLSIYDYGLQRFGKNVAERFLDPFITGIYAGDIKRLHMGRAFPKFAKKKDGTKMQMRSLQKGMGQLMEALRMRYQEHIQLGQDIRSVSEVQADVVIIATPADAAAGLLSAVNPGLAAVLQKIPYAGVSVVGLLFDEAAFKNKPDGFGYLIPSGEGKDVLGCLIESNVFAGRATGGQVLLRILFGGSHHPEVLKYSAQEMVAKAVREIESIYGLRAQPIRSMVRSWPQAIPQYELNYPALRTEIEQQLALTLHLRLAANYLDGISMNDCIANAQRLSLTF